MNQEPEGKIIDTMVTGDSQSMKAEDTIILRRKKIAGLREDVKYHDESVALFTTLAKYQTKEIAHATIDMLSAKDRIRTARASKADWLRRAALRQADSDAAANLLDEMTDKYYGKTPITTPTQQP